MSLDGDFYEQFGIYELRNIARDKGVKSPTLLNKNALITQIMEIDNGSFEPTFRTTKQGRPFKPISLPDIDGTCLDCPIYKKIKELYDLILNYITEQKNPRN